MPEILIGEYLFLRLKEMGIETVFGVPGDFELGLLDLVEPQGLTWLGTPNELVGAYAADGYARQKGAGALVTTFGPGELSALCGIGGSYCENIPVVHIVGYPTMAAQKSGKILHHTLGDGSYEHYIKMSSEISCATAVLKDPTTAVSEIDRVLSAMLHHQKPVYIGISEDVAYFPTSTDYLNTKILRTPPPPAAESEAKALNAILEVLGRAKSPILMVDGGAARHTWAGYVNDLVRALKIPVFNSLLGKGVVDEEAQKEYYGGCFAGAGSTPDQVLKAVEAADVILWLGNFPSDFNTGMFSEQIDHATIIDFQRFSVKIRDKQYDAQINTILPKLISAANNFSRPLPRLQLVQPLPAPAKPNLPFSGAIEQDWLWNRFSSFLRKGDLVVTETGTSQLGAAVTQLPSGSHLWTQAVYGSIGYAAGAAVGAAVAAKEMGTYQRLVLITGEGSLQLTVQAFSVLVRKHGIVPVVFVVNNSGYTVERFFRGWNAKYNDVPLWDYGALFKGFGPDVGEVRTFKVSKAEELDSLLSDEEFNSTEYPQCVDMVMDYEDAPTIMKTTFENKKRQLAAIRDAEQQ